MIPNIVTRVACHIVVEKEVWLGKGREQEEEKWWWWWCGGGGVEREGREEKRRGEDHVEWETALYFS
jgi:hypothetical protein